MNDPEQAATETVAPADATKKSSHAPAPRPVPLLTWSLDSTTGKPVGRWIIEAGDLGLATAA